MDEDFHLVKKEHSRDFFNSQHANYYYSARNSIFTNSSMDSFEVQPHQSLNIGELSTDYSDYNEEITNTYEEGLKAKANVEENIEPRDYVSDTSSEFENRSVIETPC